MSKRRFTLIALFLITTLLITACTGDLQEEDHLSIQEEDEIIEHHDPAEGGNLRLAVTRFNTANPLFNSNQNLQQIQHLIFDGLVAFNHGMDIEPALAESWQIAADGQSIDFTLRNGVKWHDGQPFTAEDVLFTYNVIKGNIRDVNKNSIYRGSLQAVSELKIIDDRTIRVTFNRPFSNGLEVMTFPILPKHLFTGNRIATIANEEFPLVGTGPYQLEEHHRMKNIQLKRNNDYWGEKPYIDTIDIVIVPDVEAKLSLFENGDVDVARPISVDWGRFSDHRRVNAYEFVSNNYEFVGFNFRNRFLQNQGIRRVFAYGIDRHKIVRNVYLNHATVTDVPINPQSWLYNDVAGLQYGYDLNTAVSLLENLGYTLEHGGQYRQNENGDVLSFRLITNAENPQREKTAYLIKEEMEALGVQIEIELLEWEEFNEALARGSFDLFLGGWELSPIPDLSFAFHSSQIGRTNYIAYEDEEMDRLLDEAARAASRQQKLRSYEELQQHIATQTPYLSLFFQNNAIIVRDHVRGDKEPHQMNIYKNIHDWYINTK